VSGQSPLAAVSAVGMVFRCARPAAPIMRVLRSATVIAIGPVAGLVAAARDGAHDLAALRARFRPRSSFFLHGPPAQSCGW